MFKINCLLICVVLAVFATTAAQCKTVGPKPAEQQRNFASGSSLHIKNDRVEMKVVDASKNGVTFLAMGDWGGLPVYPYRTVIEQRVAKQMTETAEENDSKFQLAIGDNFYFNGVSSSMDNRFKTTYEEVFNSAVLKETPWYMCLGNHDHYGNPEAQLDYAKKTERWILPEYNYSVAINDEHDLPLIELVVLDTILLCGNSDSKDHQAPPVFRSLDEQVRADEMWESLENHLAELGRRQDLPYILVMGHFPVWSIAEHGPTKCLVDKLRPMLHKNKVSAYFCGHDHNLQLFVDDYMDANVSYVLTGAANFADTATDHIKDVPSGSLKFHWGGIGAWNLDGGFNLVKATRHEMTVTFIESSGKELYQHVIKPRF
jgi:tartrate-resistant acid phosphatase type 5